MSDTSVRGTWRDSYPYSSLCVFALHPLYLRLQALSGGAGGWLVVGGGRVHLRVYDCMYVWGWWRLAWLDVPPALPPASLLLPAAPDDMPADIAAEIEAARCTLDVREGEPVATHRVDYEATLGAKLRIARALFDRLPPGELEGDEGFRRFCADSWEWLQPYAVFLVLRRVFGTCEHWRWGELSHPTQEVGRRSGAGGRRVGGSMQRGV